MTSGLAPHSNRETYCSVYSLSLTSLSYTKRPQDKPDYDCLLTFFFFFFAVNGKEVHLHTTRLKQILKHKCLVLTLMASFFGKKKKKTNLRSVSCKFGPTKGKTLSFSLIQNMRKSLDTSNRNGDSMSPKIKYLCNLHKQNKNHKFLIPWIWILQLVLLQLY